MASDALFEFWDSSDEPYYDFYDGQVIERPGEMVLDIPSQGGSPTYLITGALIDDAYKGDNAPARNAPVVKAKWAKIDNQLLPAERVV
jgi:hypothetical protein